VSETNQNDRPQSGDLNAAPPDVLALAVLGWVLGDQDRASRLLSLTGLDPNSLRSGLEDPDMLAAILTFLANNEPDLLACAEALLVDPQTLIDAGHALGPQNPEHYI